MIDPLTFVDETSYAVYNPYRRFIMTDMKHILSIHYLPPTGGIKVNAFIDTLDKCLEILSQELEKHKDITAIYLHEREKLSEDKKTYVELDKKVYVDFVNKLTENKKIEVLNRTRNLSIIRYSTLNKRASFFFDNNTSLHINLEDDSFSILRTIN
jgi:hypothetical protein